MTRLAAAGMVLLLSAPAALAIRDHLQCYRMRDPLALRGAIDVASAFGLESGCKLGRGKLYCEPAAKTVVSANVPVQPVGGLGLLDSRICYSVKCPKPYPAGPSVQDQFGPHGLSQLRPKLVCTPAVHGPPAPLMDNLDHLKCYQVRDAAEVHGVVDVDTLNLGVHDDCTFARSRLLCVPASVTVTKLNVSPELPILGTEPDERRLCYPVKCGKRNMGAQIASDRFGSRTLTKVTPRMLCTPAPEFTSPTTTVTTTTVTSTTIVWPDPALNCQQAIENGGLAYAREVLDRIAACTQPGGETSLATCLSSASVQTALAQRRAEWGTVTASPCTGVNLRSDLGYPEVCGAAPSTCTFASAVRDAAGNDNDVLDCLACRVEEQLQTSAQSVYAGQDATEPCRQAVGNGAFTILRSALEAMHRCVQEATGASVAACFAPDFTAWRDQARDACAGIDPFTTLGYSRYCSGVPAVAPNSYAARALPCSFTMTAMDNPPPDADLLDCATCQGGEGVLGVGRDLYGANLCCNGATCNKVLTRFACRRDGGTPARYRISTLAATNAGFAHGIDVGVDGSLYLGDLSAGAIRKVTPGGVVTTVGTGTFGARGVAVDPAGNIYVADGCRHTITKIVPGGSSTVIAGTGVAGSSGDGGLATSAQIVMPDGIAADGAGNVYFTESGILGFLCGGTIVSSERVRVIDASGMIRTIAGSSTGGGGGEGGLATLAQLFMPYGLRRGFDGTLLVGEAAGQRVVRVDGGGQLTRVAGFFTGIVGSHSGYGGPAAAARFYENCGVAQDPDGNTIVSPMEDNRVALVDTLGSVIAIAGTGEGAGFCCGTPIGDGLPGTLAHVDTPEDVAVAPDGTIYVSELATNRIRVLRREPF